MRPGLRRIYLAKVRSIVSRYTNARAGVGSSISCVRTFEASRHQNRDSGAARASRSLRPSPVFLRRIICEIRTGASSLAMRGRRLIRIVPGLPERGILEKDSSQLSRPVSPKCGETGTGRTAYADAARACTLVVALLWGCFLASSITPATSSMMPAPSPAPCMKLCLRTEDFVC